MTNPCTNGSFVNIYTRHKQKALNLDDGLSTVEILAADRTENY